MPQYADSASFCVLKHVLSRLGYTTDYKVLSAHDYGGITVRKRLCIQAHKGRSCTWPRETPFAGCLGDYLQDIPEDSPLWFGLEHWLVRYWAKQTARGNGFAGTQLTRQSTRVPTIKKRYFAMQGDSPVLRHPTDSTRFRLFTVEEVKRFMGVPAAYQLGESKTTAGEVLGQGVEVNLFTQVLKGLLA